MTTDDPRGKRPQTIDISATRAAGFAAINQHLAAAQVIATALGDLDAAYMLATEQTVDDRAAMLESDRRLMLLLNGEAAR